MEKNNRKTDNKFLWMIGAIVCVVVLAAAVTVFALVQGFTPDEDASREDDERDPAVTVQRAPIGALTIDSIEEKGEAVEVSTSYGVFKYSYAFSDIVRVEAIELEEGSALVFSALIEDESYKLYTVCFGSDEGIPVGEIKLGEKKQSYDVAVIFHDLDERLDESYHTTFYAAQETFNDVVASMAENENFTSSN